MSIEIIYVVCEQEEHEAAFMLKGFVSESRANEFSRLLTAYTEQYPEPPGPHRSNEEWKEWDAKFVAWRDNHPGGSECCMPASSYPVLKLEVER